ncbi:hypothetical protein [Ancylobacter aquaticus]|uniref:hypothetical protein n=1 Tax=Ancylobacter aquaticus TaxID=100 RepID=UPI0010474A34|nr:hypothetical protein [Ancylobacter aquaticus]
MRIAWSPALGYARPEPEVLRVTEQAVRKLEDLAATVEQVDTVFANDPADLWIGEFSTGDGTRLRDMLETKRERLDPAGLAGDGMPVGLQIVGPALGEANVRVTGGIERVRGPVDLVSPALHRLFPPSEAPS